MLYNLLLRQVVVVRCQTLHSMKQVRLVFLPGAVYGAGYPDGSDAGLFVGRGCMQPAGRIVVRAIPYSCGVGRVFFFFFRMGSPSLPLSFKRINTQCHV